MSNKVEKLESKNFIENGIDSGEIVACIRKGTYMQYSSDGGKINVENPFQKITQYRACPVTTQTIGDKLSRKEPFLHYSIFSFEGLGERANDRSSFKPNEASEKNSMKEKVKLRIVVVGRTGTAKSTISNLIFLCLHQRKPGTFFHEKLKGDGRPELLKIEQEVNTAKELSLHSRIDNLKKEFKKEWLMLDSLEKLRKAMNLGVQASKNNTDQWNSIVVIHNYEGLNVNSISVAVMKNNPNALDGIVYGMVPNELTVNVKTGENILLFETAEDSNQLFNLDNVLQLLVHNITDVGLSLTHDPNFSLTKPGVLRRVLEKELKIVKDGMIPISSEEKVVFLDGNSGNGKSTLGNFLMLDRFSQDLIGNSNSVDSVEVGMAVSFHEGTQMIDTAGFNDTEEPYDERNIVLTLLLKIIGRFQSRTSVLNDIGNGPANDLSANSVFVVMRPIDCSLKSFVQKRQGKFGDGENETIFLQVLRSLKKIVERNFVHSDIKPANLLVKEEETVRPYGFVRSVLINFGEKFYVREIHKLHKLERSLFGRVFSDYEIVKPIGGKCVSELSCAMSAVYHVRFREKDLAMKIMLNYGMEKYVKSIGEGMIVKEFLELLHFHPNILRIHHFFVGTVVKEKLQSTWAFNESFVKNKTAFFIMPLCESSLKKKMLKNGIPSFKTEKEFFSFLLQVVSGLYILKKNFFIHLDVKNDNILINEGRYLICDFGGCLDCKYFPDFKIPNAPNSTTGGAPFYRPEEIFINRDYRLHPHICYDKYEVYSLGVVCFELYSTRTPNFDELLKRKNEVRHYIHRSIDKVLEGKLEREKKFENRQHIARYVGFPCGKLMKGFEKRSVFSSCTEIFVQMLDGKFKSYDVHLNRTTRYLKQLIEEKEGIPSKDLRLLYNGIDMVDDLTLDEHDLKLLGTVNLSLSLRGGSSSREEPNLNNEVEKFKFLHGNDLGGSDSGYESLSTSSGGPKGTFSESRSTSWGKGTSSARKKVGKKPNAMGDGEMQEMEERVDKPVPEREVGKMEIKHDPLREQTGNTESTEIKKFGYEYKRCGIVGCNKDTQLCCPECKTVEHQRFDWRFHKQVCPTIRFAKKLKCPLTKCYFIEPVKNTFCRHVFEKDAIMRYMRKTPNQNTKCPFDNCEKFITKSSLVPDHYMKRMVVTFLYTIDYRHAPTIGIEYLKENKVVNMNSRVGVFYEKREIVLTVRVLYLGKKDNISRRELFFKFDQFLKMLSLVKQFLRRNDVTPDPKDFPNLVYNGEVVDLQLEAREIGVKDGVTFFVQFPSDEEAVRHYDENQELKDALRKCDRKISEMDKDRLTLEKENEALKRMWAEKGDEELLHGAKRDEKFQRISGRRDRILVRNFEIAKRGYIVDPKFQTDALKEIQKFQIENSQRRLGHF